MDRNRLIILVSVTPALTRVGADPAADSRKRVLFQNRFKCCSVLSISSEIDKPGNGVASRTGLLTRGCHKDSLRFLKTPFAGVDYFGTAIGDRDNQFKRLSINFHRFEPYHRPLEGPQYWIPF